MELLDIKANIRKNTGSSYAKFLRHENLIPAVLYGKRTESFLLTINLEEIKLLVKKGLNYQSLINLSIVQDNDIIKKTVMLKNVQVHPLNNFYFHIDFYEIDMDRKIKIKIPIEITGKSKGVERGGIVQIIRHEVECLCFPREIPNTIKIDVTDLDIGDSIHVNEIPLLDNLEIAAGDVNFTIVTISSGKTKEETKTELEEANEKQKEEVKTAKSMND